MSSEIEELCGAVLEARDARDKLKTELYALDEKVSAAETKLSAALSDEKVTHEGFTFAKSTTVSWKTLKDSKDKLLALIKQGVPELVKESVNASSLSAYLRKNEATLEADAPAWWAQAKGYVERSESEKLSIRKAAKAKE